MWLGDGASTSAQISSGDADVEEMCTLLESTGARIVSRRRDRTCWTVRVGVGTLKQSELGARLRQLGVWGDKHVPDQYLTAAEAQREALIQGLMDTDGSIGTNGHAEFCSTNQRLAAAVLFLARSLGWRAVSKESAARIEGREVGRRWRVTFTPVADDPFNPFRLVRKSTRRKPSDGRRGRATLSIESIVPVESRPVRCIKVGSPDGLFLAGRDLVPTHNTTLILALAVHRALGFDGQRQVIAYGAQTRNDARIKWEDEHVLALERSKVFRKLFSVRKTNGNEAILWRNGSKHGIVANTEKSGHGATLDLGFLDEAFSQVDNRMEQAFKPAMITRPQPQLWVVSTAGNDSSVYLKQKMAAGRAAVEGGSGKGLAYFEWSAPEDADPSDPATWRACMPALGHTISEEAIAADFSSMELIEFQRAYLNQWPDRNATDPVIQPGVWAHLADTRSQVVDPVVFAVDAAPDRSSAAIAIAGRRTDGVGHVEVVDRRDGTGWLLERVKELHARWRPAAWVLDPASAAGSLLPALQDLRIEPVLVTGREMAQACGQFYEDVVERHAFRHRDQPELNKALYGAQKRRLSDAWAWDKRTSGADISPLVAATLAWHGVAVKGTPVRSAYDSPDAELMVV
ncbi:terminase large subunit [Pseudonocardia autotrophica]|uniref:terminase large subunit n=1 Tax=Pseudonocardia autotrophica TaxID=2074 RepID=UPI001B803E2F|nr:terminase large subunit [Pseudonocardia autotrophica]